MQLGQRLAGGRLLAARPPRGAHPEPRGGRPPGPPRGPRDGVQAAKVALGERGRPWWEQTDAERQQRWETAVPLPE